VLSATTRRRFRPIASPVFGFTSNRGKFELDTSSRIRCPIPIGDREDARPRGTR
jgi:hypothetical protein